MVSSQTINSSRQLGVNEDDQVVVHLASLHQTPHEVLTLVEAHTICHQSVDPMSRVAATCASVAILVLVFGMAINISLSS